MAALTCDACGGTSLTMTDDGQFSVCDFCGTKHTMERIRVKVQEIKGVVEITKGEAEKNRLLKNAETWLDLNEPEKAKEIFTLLTNDYPDDYRGWLGLLNYECKYQEINRYWDVYGPKDGTTFNQICIYANHVSHLTKDQAVINSVVASIREYFERCSSKNPRYYFEMLSLGYDNLGTFASYFQAIHGEIKKFEQLQIRFDALPVFLKQTIAERLYQYSSVHHTFADDYHCTFVDQNRVGFRVSIAYCGDQYVTLRLNAPFSTLIDQAVLENRKETGVCAHCGGSFTGLFKPKCSVCGRPKDYK